MGRWPKDSVAEQIKFYGLPGPQVEAQLVKVIPPFKLYYEGKPVAAIKFHKKCAGALAAALDEVWEYYKHDQKKIDALGISRYNGAYNPRPVRGYPLEVDPYKTRWSNHAFGAAIDFNADANGFGKGKGNIPQPLIDAFKRQGARWGGDYHGRTDPMHFEFVDAGPVYVKPVSLIADAEEVTAVDNDRDPPETDAVEPTAVVPNNATPAEQEQQVQDSSERDAEPRTSWLKRKWKSIAGLISGGGATGLLGFMTSPWAIVAVFGCLLVIAILIVLFMGPSDVRAWVRKQVS